MAGIFFAHWFHVYYKKDYQLINSIDYAKRKYWGNY